MSSVTTAAGFALIGPFFIGPLLQKANVMDVPNDRSSHSSTTLRAGGIVSLIALLAGGSFAIITSPSAAALSSFTIVVAIAAAVSVVGVIEDVRGLSIKWRAGLQLVLGTSLGATLAWMLSTSFLWIPLVSLVYAAYVNIANFMDGIDSISSLNGGVVGVSYAALGYIQGLEWLAAVGALTAVVFVCFLPWNLIGPKMFLGDVGSYLLGGLCVGMAITATAIGISPISAFAPLSIYCTDAMTTMVRRAANGENVLHAHRSHVYQRLTNIGLTHVKVGGVVALFSAAASTVGIFAPTSGPRAWGTVITIGAICAVYALLPHLLGGKSCSQPHSRSWLTQERA